MSYFECFSVTVWTISCFNPKLRLFFVRNWILLYIDEREPLRTANSIRSSYNRLTFCIFPSEIWCKITKLLKYYGYQLTKCCLEGRLESLKISSWFLKIMKLVEYRIAKTFQEFHHYCRSLHHWPYSQGCHVRFYLMKQSFTLTTWF